ncbi:MAG: hypothetical protein A2V93_11095 [Ignavibacteria bacterium RBG_16_34_14]|nr:MAG: hypothetical protein A2V93_11095 [Ignavibacteria bacterium RBG_16_34_14]
MRKKIATLVMFIGLFSFTKVSAQYENMSEEEIKKKASEMGYNIDDYPKQQQNFTPPETKTTETVVQPVNKPLSSYSVAAFSDREKAKDLSAFGYNIFSHNPTTFEPSSNIPIPTNYVVGPGDEIIVTLWGETQLVHNVTVSKEGSIYIPNAGLINVSGLSLVQVKNKIYNLLSETYSSLSVTEGAGTNLDVSTGKLRSIKVFVLGEVSTPGGYTLPALSTSFTALYYSGGPTLNGSLRKIQINRRGKVISEIDLYDYIISGDKSKDIKLEDEDIIFVPPVNERIAIAGNVFRPAVYEMKQNESLKDLLKFAGSLTFNAYYNRLHIERIIPFDQRNEYVNNILDLDLNFSSVEELKNSNYDLVDGDVVSISGVNKLSENVVKIYGNVRKPGVYQLTQSLMTVKDLVNRADSTFPEAFLSKATLIRTLPNEKKEIITFNLAKALAGDPYNNLVLQNRDEVTVYTEETFLPTKNVEIAGAVRNPGSFIRYQNMTLSELIILAGGLTDAATTNEIEITRLDTLSSEVYAQKFSVNLPKDYWVKNKQDDFLLQDFDRVLIKKDPTRNFEQTIGIEGEALYPGSYSILYEGERITDFLSRAGGFKNTAYKEGIYVKRETKILTKIETAEITDSLQKLYLDKPIYNRESFNKEFSNRIPIPWDEIEDDNSSEYNIVLNPGDVIVIPKNPNVVYVTGEVGIPSSVPYKKGASLSYYVEQAGGYLESSAESDEIVVQPNGKKWSSSGWFFIPNSEILSGTTILIPSMIESDSDSWPIIRDIVTVVSSAAVVILTVTNLTK